MGPIDTVLRDKERLITNQEVDNFYNYGLVGGTYMKKSIFSWDSLGKKWTPGVDTIFNSKGEFRITIRHYFFKGTQIDLVNSYIRDPWTTRDNRFSYFIVLDKIHFINSFRIIDEQEVYRQYIVAKQYTSLKGGGMEYISVTYDDFGTNTFNDLDYGITFKLDKKTKFIQEIHLSDLFYHVLRPSLVTRIEKIVVFDHGRTLKFE
jgi:hypothetical protein